MMITRKFWMISVTGIITTVVAGALVGWNLYDIATLWKEKTTVTELLSRAAYEMEINVNGAGMAVFKYVETREPRNVERFNKDVSDFRRFWEEFNAIARDPESQGLAKRAHDMFQAYETVGKSLIALTDSRHTLLVSIIKNISELDNIVDQYQDTLRNDPEKTALFLSMEADLAQTFVQLTLYLLAQENDGRKTVEANLERFSKHVADFAGAAKT